MYTLYGMTMRDWTILKRMMSIDNPDAPETVAQYIERTNVKTEVRTSKRGVTLVKVFYENGTVKEYEADKIHRIIALEV